MSTDLEQRITKLEEFAADVREFTAAVRDMIRRHDERLDEHADLFRETDAKIAALADAQIKTEATVQQLGEHIEALINTVERHVADGHGAQG